MPPFSLFLHFSRHLIFFFVSDFFILYSTFTAHRLHLLFHFIVFSSSSSCSSLSSSSFYSASSSSFLLTSCSIPLFSAFHLHLLYPLFHFRLLSPLLNPSPLLFPFLFQLPLLSTSFSSTTLSPPLPSLVLSSSSPSQGQRTHCPRARLNHLQLASPPL